MHVATSLPFKVQILVSGCANTSDYIVLGVVVEAAAQVLQLEGRDVIVALLVKGRMGWAAAGRKDSDVGGEQKPDAHRPTPCTTPGPCPPSTSSPPAS